MTTFAICLRTVLLRIVLCLCEAFIQQNKRWLPEDAEQTLAGAQETATAELAGLVETLYGEHGDEIEAVARDMKPCEYCATQHYEEFVLRELLNRALIDLTENGTVESVRRGSEDAGDEAESHDDENGR